MNKQKQFSFNKSSLVSLQAELARKKEEAANVNNNVPSSSSKLQIKAHIQQQINAKKESRKEKIQPVALKEEVESISELENRVKESLLTKTKLYEKLRNKELVAEEENNFLVNFEGECDDVIAVTNDEQKEEKNIRVSDEKNEEEFDSDLDDEWITFVDALGRSRTCLRTDLDYYKKLDSRLKVDEHLSKQIVEETPVKQVSEEVLLWDKRRDELRKIWEDEENRLSKKANIHYQDVLFNEARTHGVGYFNFSQDENERMEQQEALKKLREETVKNQKIASIVKERRNNLMKQRIAAAKRRKRIQMGLPPDVDEEENEPIVYEKSEEKLEIKKEGPLEQKIDEFLNSMKRSAHVRPWDVGKDGVKAAVATQSEWNEKQRAKRIAEFAPPTSYNADNKPEETSFADSKRKRQKTKKLNDAKKKTLIDFESGTRSESYSNSERKNKGTEIPPPLSYGNVIDKNLKNCDIRESIEAGLNYLKNMEPNKSKTIEDRIRRDYN